jgi:mRNA interferase MazF
MKYRWSIHLANLDPVVGSEQGKTRPVLIISDEEMNQVVSTLNVLPITSQKPLRIIYTNEVLIQDGIAGLSKNSIVLCQQIRTLDKKRLIKFIGTLDDISLQKNIVEALRFQLGLNL